MIAIALFAITTNGNTTSWNLDSFYSTSHTENIKSSTSELEVKWESTENEDWFGFWCAFSEGSAITLDDDYEGDYDEISARTLGIWENNWTRSSPFTDSGTTAYYFNLSVVDIEGDPHPVSSIGPFFIDTEPPGSPRFTVPETTNTPNVILDNIGAVGAVDMCISNSGFGVGCGWENIQESKFWNINDELNSITTIYIQFRDDVDNKATVSASTTYTITSMTEITGLVQSVPTLNEWGQIMLALCLLIFGIGKWGRLRYVVSGNTEYTTYNEGI